MFGKETYILLTVSAVTQAQKCLGQKANFFCLY